MRKILPGILVVILFACAAPEEARFNWNMIRPGEWVEVPTFGKAAPKVFHGGAALSVNRGEVYFFGSDTHAPTALENGESNSLWRLNLTSRVWSRDYAQDPKSTWRILPDSQCVTTSGRPWAMHTFDAVAYDPLMRRLVVVSFPKHARFEPEERFPMFEGGWYRSLAPSHWEYDPDSGEWILLKSAKAPDLFAASMVWDRDRQALLGHSGDRTWIFDRGEGEWVEQEGAATRPGWHLSMVYDTFARRALLYGGNGGSDTLWAYNADVKQWSVVPTTGDRPMPANGACMAYDINHGVMLYLANDYENQYNNPTGRAVTFIYHSRDSRWERLEIESPPLYGMNYLMQYDPVRNVFLHFEKSEDSGDRLRVWAFRYDD